MSISEPKSKIYKLDKLSIVRIREMYEVFLKYYSNVDFETFINDLSKKQYVILMTDRSADRVVGFSTICLLDLDYKGRKVKGLFSGDTILEKEYWGARRWQITWAAFCLKQKLMNLRTPFFWLLISKGYKTYLLLANNFVNYYPRYNRHDSGLEDIVDSYCRTLYPEHYDSDGGVLDFGEQYQKLQGHVAEIDESLKENNPKIRFFEEMNPTWRNGTELPCVGVVEFKAFFKLTRKVIRERSPGFFLKLKQI